MIVFIHLLLLFSEKEKRETELVVDSTDDVIFCDRSQHMNIRLPPTRLQFVKEIKVGADCSTVCHYKGFTYVGLQNGAIDRIDDQGNVTSAFIELAKRVISIRAHNDQLFILTCMYGEPYKIHVYDLNGLQSYSWYHSDKNRWYHGNKISVLNNQLAVPDVTNECITLYTPAGEVIRHIQCAEIADTHVSLCECDDNSVIISRFHPAKVFKFNVLSSYIQWTNTDVSHPLTVRCYGRYVLIGGDYIKNTLISVINSETGDFYVLYTHAID